MGFMDKAKKLAEQAQQKLDEVQQSFNEGGSTPGQGARSPLRRARTPGRGQRRRAAATPPPSAEPVAPTPEPGAESADPAAASAATEPTAPQPPPPTAATPTRAPTRSSRSSSDRRHPHRDGHAVRPTTGVSTRSAPSALIHHLLDNGSDGLVLAGTTGEGATLTDDEKLRLWELGVAEAGDATVIAGTGTNDTAHSVELTERATEAGVDAVLVVTPYYIRPNRRGIVAHYEAVAAATDRPIVVYNIPSRTAIDMPNDLLAELGQIDNVAAVKQARYEDMTPIDGIDLLAGNDDMLAETMDVGGTGGILVASHLVGREMRRMIDEPESRHEIEDGLRDLFEALIGHDQPDPRQGRAQHGRRAGRRAAAAAGRGHRRGEGSRSRGARAPRAARRGVTPRARCASSRSAGSARSART